MTSFKPTNKKDWFNQIDWFDQTGWFDSIAIAIGYGNWAWQKKKKKVGENNGQLRFVRHHGWHTQARLDQNNGQLCFHGSRLDQLVKCESEAKCEAKYVKTTCQMMLKLRVKHFQRMLYKQIAVLNYIQFVMLVVFVRLYVMSGNI